MADSTPSSTESSQADEQEARLRQRLEENPEDFDTLAALAVHCADRGRFAEGRDLLERAIAIRPDDPRLHLSAAGMAANDGDLDAAASAYRKALLLHENLPAAHVGLGQIDEDSGRFSSAEEHYNQALNIDVDSVDALLGLARLRLHANHVEQAVQMFAQATQRHPRHARALAGYGQALMMRGMPEQAGRPLKRALELDPGLSSARLLLGHVELYRNNARAAEKAYREVLHGEPANADALAGLGDALRAQGRMDEAFLAYDAARRRRPDVEALTALRATCLGAIGREEEAIEDLRQFIGTHPRCAAPRLLLADVLHHRGQHAQVQAMWQQAADADESDAMAHAELALLHEVAGDYVASAAAAQKSTADVRPHVRLMRARAALRQTDHETAQRELLALKGAALPDAMKHDRLRLMGMVHDRAGRWAEAVLAFREAHRIDARPLPPLAAAELLREALPPMLAEPELEQPRLAPPVLLMGLPGSGVEQVAALLADQRQLAVREDRFVDQTDLFAHANDPALLVGLTQSRLGVQARRYARVQERHVGGNPDVVIDWLPVFDARLLPVIKRALPGVRVIIVDADPRVAYLRWLAFGWQRRLRMSDAKVAAKWWALGRQQLDLAAEHLPVVRVSGDELLDNPADNGRDLARFLGLDSLTPGALSAHRAQSSAGLPTRFPAGHEANYREVLAEAFALLG